MPDKPTATATGRTRRRRTARRGSAPAPYPEGAPASPAVILVEPQLGENIGAAARAMANFGLEDLRLVAPRDGWPNETAIAAAAGGAWVAEGAKVYGTLEEAVADLHFVCATTARPREMLKPVLKPDTAVAEFNRRAREGQCCGLLFGRERDGLSNDHISLADAIVTAPVNPRFASLNLAQAVLLIGYEWVRQHSPDSLGRATRFDGPASEGLNMPRTRPATRAELSGFFGQLEKALDESGFLYPPDKRPTMVRNIRNMFHRMGATEQDIRSLRGIVASLAKPRRRGGQSS
ncbi:MAG: RNA methyltransferase [Hyphomicrobiales bacterium]